MSQQTSPAAAARRPVEVLTAEEVKALMRACSPRAPTGARNRALVAVLWRGGLRIAEALALRPKELDPVLGSVRVLHGKGDKARTVGLDPQAFALVDRWLDVRPRLGVLAGPPEAVPRRPPRRQRREEQTE
ncbi:MAG: tyrosine-type recombinase/integrase [bacterium]|nr:tyrosine-type recombinase/integrase [bacterium]